LCASRNGRHAEHGARGQSDCELLHAGSSFLARPTWDNESSEELFRIELDIANDGATIWRAEPVLVPASMVAPVMPWIEGVGAEHGPIAKMAAMVAVAPVSDLFDRTSTINGGTCTCRGAEGRSLSAIRDQRAGRKRGHRDVDE
jgi:hypothetical protein